MKMNTTGQQNPEKNIFGGCAKVIGIIVVGVLLICGIIWGNRIQQDQQEKYNYAQLLGRAKIAAVCDIFQERATDNTIKELPNGRTMNFGIPRDLNSNISTKLGKAIWNDFLKVAPPFLSFIKNNKEDMISMVDKTITDIVHKQAKAIFPFSGTYISMEEYQNIFLVEWDQMKPIQQWKITPQEKTVDGFKFRVWITDTLGYELKYIKKETKSGSDKMLCVRIQ
jgi:hypothetical protein